MVARTLWLWLSLGWLTEAAVNPSTTSICDLGPCTCTRGKLLCDCTTSVIKEITLKVQLLDSFSFSTISVANCPHVHVASRALSELPALQQVSVANIARLTLEEQAFSWSTENLRHGGLLVNISNSVVPEIPSYCFRGSLQNILFDNVSVAHVRSYAFASLDRAEKINFNKVYFDDLETQSFKKFSVEFLTFFASHFGVLRERTLMNIDVYQEARLDSITASRIESSAFKIHSPRNFRLVKSSIGYIESNAFHVHTKGDVSIHDNVFSHLERGAFAEITVDKKYLQEAGKQDFVFENNTLVNFEMESLSFNTTGLNPRLDWIMITQPCSCDSAQSWSEDLIILSDSSPKTPAPQANVVEFCLDPKPKSVRDFQRLYCNVVRTSLLVKVIIVACVLLSLSVICLIIYCRVKKKGKRYINVPTATSAQKPAELNRPHILVVPDGKTYRETELHVMVENLEPIIPTEFVKERPDRNGNE